MSVEAMKQALEALEKDSPWREETIASLRQAIEQAEKREWVGLTQKELDDLWDVHHDAYGYQLSADGYERAIEAKLKDKNT